MEKPLLDNLNEVEESLSKAELVKFQSFEDKLAHLNPHVPFLAVLGADTDRLMEVFTHYIQRAFAGPSLVVTYTDGFDLSNMAKQAGDSLLIFQLPLACIKDKKKIAEHFLFYRDVIKEKELRLVVICNIEIFDELQLKAADFISMGLDVNRYTDFKAVVETDLKENEYQRQADIELQDAVDDLNRYKQFGLQNEDVLFEKFVHAIFLARRYGQSKIALKISFEMLDYAVRLNAKYFEMRAKGGIALAYDEMGLKNQSAIYLKEALKKAFELKDEDSIALLQNSLAGIYKDNFQYEKAEKLSQSILKYFEARNDKMSISTVLCNLGILYQKQSRYKESLKFFTQAETILKLGKDKKSKDYYSCLGSVNANLAAVFAYKGEIKRGLDYFHRALKLYQMAANQSREANMLNMLSQILLATGGYSLALSYCKKSIALSLPNNNPQALLNASVQLCLVYSKLEKWEDARGSLGHAENYAAEINSVWSKIDLQITNATLSLDMNNFSAAEKYYETAYTLSNKINSKENIGQSALGLGICNLKRGNIESANRFAKEALINTDEEYMLLYRPQILALTADIKLEEGYYDEGLKLSLKALKLCRKMQLMEDQVDNLVRIFVLYNKTVQVEIGNRYLNEAKSIAATMDNKEKLFRKIAEAEKRVVAIII